MLCQLDGAFGQELLLTYELKRNNSMLASELSSCRSQQEKAAQGLAGEVCSCSNGSLAMEAKGSDTETEQGLEKVKRERDSVRKERDEALLKLVECQLNASPPASPADGSRAVGGAQEDVETAFAAAAHGEAACCSQTCNAEC